MKKESSKREAIELINKAYNLVEEGKLGKAKRLLEKALDICDEIADGHNELGVVYCLLGDFSSAYHHACRAIELDPTNPKYHNSLAFALMSMGWIDDALVSARTAIGLDPNYASAHNLVSKILKMKGVPEERASYHDEKAENIYASTGMRSDGHKLKAGDLERFFTKRETIKIPESTESINVKGIKWALSQIKKDPYAAAKSKTVREAVMNPIARWSFVIIAPIAGFLGFTKLGQIVLGHRLMFIVFGLFFVLLAVIAERAYKDQRINVMSALFGKPVNPIRVRISIKSITSIGYGIIAYSLGTFIHKAFCMYELVIAGLSVILLIKAISNLGTKHGWYPVSVMKDAHYTNGKNYENLQYDFSISSPEGWKIEADEAEVLVSFNSPERGVSINVAVNAIYDSNLLKGGFIDVAKYYVKQIYSDLRSNEKGSIITLNVSDECKEFPAIVVDYPFWGRHHRKIAFFLRTHLYGGYEFLITCGAPKDKFPLHEDAFNQCVQTFRFLHLRGCPTIRNTNKK